MVPVFNGLIKHADINTLASQRLEAFGNAQGHRLRLELEFSSLGRNHNALLLADEPPPRFNVCFSFFKLTGCFKSK